ncbi:hypothetical protein B7494_g5190 [Chlorociboria aeruginascens]|nr:hypothetical protein B7494_g5190 [Chlorociboria aeruginascens]
MADSNEGWKDEEEEEEEELDENDYRSQKDAVLFAIDVSETMLTPLPESDNKKANRDSPTAAALKCAYQIMQQRIISNPKDMMGILLFGTDKSKFQGEAVNSSRSSSAYPHCYLLSDLDIPSAVDVKTLKNLVEDEDEAKYLLVPSEEPVSMSNMLFCANQIFTTKAPNFGSRRLFIISDNDSPHSSDKIARSAAAVRAKDLYDLGVIIELFPISQPDHEFDRTKFYDDIIYRDPTEVDEPSVGSTALKSGGDGISLLNNLISDVNSKNVAKRSLFSNMPFEIGPGFKISVKGFNVLQKQQPARSCYVYLGGETAEIVVGETKQLAADTDKDVQKVDVKKAYKFGGEQVLFTPEEQKKLKDFGSPCIRIIGFKPQSMLPIWASVKKSTFIYPSEESYVGSTRVFSALWQKLLKDNKMGLAWFIARANATPLLVAILPSTERLDETTKGQVIPAGLWLYPLPFADDIRQPADSQPPFTSPDILVDGMRKVVQQLQLPKAIYDPSKYPNPSLQWHYRILQAIALEEEVPEIPDDKTLPKYRQIEKRAGSYLHGWRQILEKESEPSQRPNVKREASLEVEAGRPKKKAKAAPQSLDSMSVDDLRKAIESESLGKFTVGDLKDWLFSKGISTSGKKPQLIERVEQWVEDN